jgi:hypothetical protein
MIPINIQSFVYSYGRTIYEFRNSYGTYIQFMEGSENIDSITFSNG